MRSLSPFVPLALLCACATVPIPEQQRTQSLASIHSAEDVGASSVPMAALHLQMAREQAERANQLVREGENHRAAMLFKRAEADAELAVVLAREEPLRLGAQRTLAQLRTAQANSNSTPVDRGTP